ncbi:MAG: DNA integrity scanning protein DisA nucleotide-binding domain protein [Candidatus Omnitrophica bacterium]|nr:DNA integrity scanning protein DisA nucleotide-binding domain protein [Candidatus Omnitrophota bacterium]
MNLPVYSTAPIDLIAISTLIAAGVFFSTRYVLTRRTWLSPVIFLAFTILLAIPFYLSMDPWAEVASFRPILLGSILVFFFLSPVLEWLDAKRIEAEGQRKFRHAAHEIQLTFEALAREKIGALVAIEREDSLAPIARKGIPVKGEITKEVLATLFTPYTPTHDGGVIIADRKIAACGCVFPLSADEHLSKDLGTRHRAALGLSEKTDALVLVASEESGEISVASYGKLHHNISPEHLEKRILAELGHTRHKTKLNFPMVSSRRLRITKQGAHSSTSLARRILILTGALFFATLFVSFAPKDWLSNKQGWVFTIPAAAAIFLLLRTFSGSRTIFHPEIRQVERAYTFLGVPVLKRAWLYEKLKGMSVYASKKWKNLYELRLTKSRFKSWLILESKNLRKLEDAQMALDPPRAQTNFGSATPSTSI